MILEISFYVHFPSVHLVSVNLQLLLLTASKLTMAILWPTVTLNMTSCNRLSDIRVVSFFFFLRILCSDDILSCVCSFSLWYYTWGSVYSSRWVLCSMWNSCKVTSGCLCLGSTLVHRGWSWMNLTVLWLFPKHHQLILRKNLKTCFIQIQVQICTDIHGYQTMNPNDSGDLLRDTFVVLSKISQQLMDEFAMKFSPEFSEL